MKTITNEILFLEDQFLLSSAKAEAVFLPVPLLSKNNRY